MSDLNKSGREPFGTRVMVKMKSVSKKTDAGIIIDSSEQSWEMRQLGCVVGQIVAMGETAFYDSPDHPNVGDYVIVKRYAGIHIEGVDGGAYRCCLDIDIHTKTVNGDDVETIG